MGSHRSFEIVSFLSKLVVFEDTTVEYMKLEEGILGSQHVHLNESSLETERKFQEGIY